jgi:hypothetical protein
VRRFSNDGRALGGVALTARATSGQTFNPPTLATTTSGNALFAWMALTQDNGGTVFQGQLREQRTSGLAPVQPLNCFGNPVAVSAGTQLGAVCVAFDVAPAQQIALRAFVLDQGAVVPLFDFASAGQPFSSPRRRRAIASSPPGGSRSRRTRAAAAWSPRWSASTARRSSDQSTSP